MKLGTMAKLQVWDWQLSHWSSGYDMEESHNL